MSDVTYKVSDFKKLVSESSNEFKAKLGAGVESKNKEINGKAYKDAEKRAKDYDGGLKDEVKKPKYEKVDGNYTTLDYNPENASDEYKKRVHAQAKGYTSEAEMNNGIEKGNDYSDNENIYQGIKKAGQEMHKNVEDFKRSGLQASKMPKKTFEKDEMYESKEGFDMRNLIDTFKSNNPSTQMNETFKVVKFKKTTFLNEEHMLSKIPDEFKVEGSQFKMRDNTLNEYIIEWKNNKGHIIGHNNKKGMVESIERMKKLYDYSSTDSKTDRNTRLNENDSKFEETLNKMRQIIK